MGSLYAPKYVQKHSADRNGLPVISFSYEDQSNKQFVMRRLSSHEWCQETPVKTIYSLNRIQVRE